MKNQILLNKGRLTGLYGKLIIRLNEINKLGKYIEWGVVYEKIGRGFSIKKPEIRELIFFLRDIGYCDVSCKGIRLCWEIRE